MNIAIDMSALLPVATGVDNYLKNLVHQLARIDRANNYRIYINREDRALFSDLRNQANFRVVARSTRSRVIRLLFQQLWLPAACFLWADVIHSPSFIMPFVKGRQRHILTVQDMTSFTLPEHHIPLRRSLLYRFLVTQSIRRSHLISVPSEATKANILTVLPEICPEKIIIIPYGSAEEFRPCDNDQVSEMLKRLDLPPRYVLSVGTVEPRKNLPRIIASYVDLVEQQQIEEHLVIAGNFGWGYEDLLERYGGSGNTCKQRIHFTGYVRQKDLPLLYSGATLFVYASLEEGFGLPPLEAMACGTPVITSNKSSLAEYYRGAAELVDPENVGELSAAMSRLLADAALQKQRSRMGLELSKKFSWRHMAEQTLACYRRLAETNEPGLHKL